MNSVEQLLPIVACSIVLFNWTYILLDPMPIIAHQCFFCTVLKCYMEPCNIYNDEKYTKIDYNHGLKKF